MLITNGNIKTIIDWFLRSDNKFDVLLLFAGGHSNDYQFFDEFYSNKEIFHVISGPKIALVLFGKITDEISFYLSKGSDSKGEVAPCLIFHGNPGFWDKDVKHVVTLSIENINDDVKARIIQDSINITTSIMEYFDLSVSEIPCILILTKNKDDIDYSVIPTHGEQNIKLFYEFLKKLVLIVDKMKLLDKKYTHNKMGIYYGPLYLPKLKKDLIKIKKDRNAAAEDYEKLDIALSTQRRNLWKKYKRLGHEIKWIESGIKVSQYEAKQYLSEEKALQNEFDKILIRYSRILSFRSCIKPAREIFNTLFGISKKTNDFLQLESQIDELLEETSNTIFLSYAREDYDDALKIYNKIKSTGIEVWFDKEKIKPGQNWKLYVNRAIKNSKYFLALLSENSISKKGYVQKELKIALDVLDEYPNSDIFIIPVRLNECIPIEERIAELHWIDLFPCFEKGIDMLLSAITKQR